MKNRTALHWAAYRDNKDMLIVVRDRGGDVNAQDTRGHTCAHIAARYRRNLVWQFLRSVSDLSIRDNDGRTTESYMVEESAST